VYQAQEDITIQRQHEQETGLQRRMGHHPGRTRKRIKEELIMNLIFRSLIYLAAFILPIVLIGTAGLIRSVETSIPRPADHHAAEFVPPPPPPYDPSKPTVAVVLGEQEHEITDTLGPYAMFAETGLYNVYMVAQTRAPRAMAPRTGYALTGAIDLVPHLTFGELNALLHRRPDIVVVPQMNGVDAPENEPLLDYIRQQAHNNALILSWCTGANVLAQAGLLDGRSATAHWGDIDRLERTYPAVRWQRGVRYVDDGNVVTTGGVTSGMDGTLYLLKKLHGAEVAERVARAMHYQPTIELDATPTVEQYTIGLGETVILLNGAFKWAKPDTAVWVYDGIGDMELSAVLDAYPVSLATHIYTVGATRGIVTSQYGLQLVPHWDVATLPPVDRLLVPGGPSTAATNSSLAAVEGRIAAPIVRLHDPARPRPAFESPLEDLARQTNVPTAAFANKRLEYRGVTLQLAGSGWPLLLMLQPLLIGSLGVGLAWWLIRRHDRRAKRDSREQAGAASMAHAGPAR
jgi:AraC family transcriptional regulator, transcriptional activator FtrA